MEQEPMYPGSIMAVPRQLGSPQRKEETLCVCSSHPGLDFFPVALSDCCDQLQSLHYGHHNPHTLSPNLGEDWAQGKQGEKAYCSHLKDQPIWRKGPKEVSRMPYFKNVIMILFIKAMLKNIKL